MQIREVNFQNFRVYKGFHHINLETESRRNIIIVSGFNGYGKTTFLMGLVWCLYGKHMVDVDETFNGEIAENGGYNKYISNSINRIASIEGERKFSIAITFSNVEISAIPCKEITIRRTYDILSSNPETLEILFDGETNELIEEYGKDLFVRDFILPIESAKFFFFDAEKIVTLAKANSSEQRRELSKAYSEVLGIKKYYDLCVSIEDLQLRYKKDSATIQDRQKLNELQTSHNNAEVEIEAKQFEIEDTKDKISRLRYEAKQFQDRLIQEANVISSEDLAQMRIRTNEVEVRQTQLKENLNKLLDYAPFAIAGDLLVQVAEQSDLENENIADQFQEEEVERKTEIVLDELDREKTGQKISIPFQIQEFYATQIRKLIRRHFFDIGEASQNEVEHFHEFMESERKDLKDLISTLKHSFAHQFRQATKEYSSLLTEKTSLQRQLHDAESKEEDEMIKEFRGKKNDLERQISQAESLIEQNYIRIGELNNELNQLKRQLSELSKKIETADKYKEKDELSKRLTAELREFINKYKVEKKKSLEDRILKSLNELMHKKSVGKVQVSMIDNDIEIKIFNTIGAEIPKGQMSMGEKQLYATALLKALVDESGIDFPVFVDSPMQKFDEKHAENIISHFYPNISQQVVIFPILKKELTQEEFKKLEKHVNKCYLITRVKDDHSEFLPVPEHQLFEKYEELNAA